MPESLRFTRYTRTRYSPQWLAYWTERTDQILNGEDEVKGCLIPLEVMDAIIEAAESAPLN